MKKESPQPLASPEQPQLTERWHSTAVTERYPPREGKEAHGADDGTTNTFDFKIEFIPLIQIPKTEDTTV
ncbi:MAG: hypothetical protein IJS61_05330 [Firmicutes bacterium]|nr:hypothetical protein [Bacillota bacterium]